MKRTFSKFRIMIRAIGVGLAAVFMWQALSIARQNVPVDLPKAQSANVLVVTVPLEQPTREPKYICDEFTDENYQASCLHRLTFEDREMSVYDNFGRQGCSFEELNENRRECDRSLAKARRFIWEHWKNRNRAYVAVAKGSDGRTWTTHLFVEPTEEGTWRVVERTVPMLREPLDPEHYRLGDLIDIKWERATEDDIEYGLSPGTMYLRLSNITGDFLIL